MLINKSTSVAVASIAEAEEKQEGEEEIELEIAQVRDMRYIICVTTCLGYTP